MQLPRLAWALTAAAVSLLLLLLLHGRLLREGQLAAGTCEIITLDRDRSQPRRTIARQTARCACRKGQIAGTTGARPACVDAGIVRSRRWCDMSPCLGDEGCNLLINQSGWTCTQPGGRIKTTTDLAWRKADRLVASNPHLREDIPAFLKDFLLSTGFSMPEVEEPSAPGSSEMGISIHRDSPPFFFIISTSHHACCSVGLHYKGE
ncbi:chemokine-like protein TAFA-1 [Pholidichthys leucotaenia]